MAEIVRMPKMSDTMTEGVLAKWHKKVGDKVKSGDLVAEIETDKATMEFESYQEGTLLYRGVEEGTAVPVDGVLAVLGAPGEDYQALLNEANASAKPNGTSKNGKAEGEQEQAKTAAEAPAGKTSPPVQPKQPIPSAKPAPSPKPVVQSVASTDSRIKASPLAKKLSGEKGIDLSQVSGTGEHGRIVRRDIEWYKSQPAPAARPSAKAAAVPIISPEDFNRMLSGITDEESFDEVAVSQMRKTIARRLAESKFTAPHFYLTMEIDMDNAVSARESIVATTGVKISYNDIVIKAVALALKLHPQVNASWLGDTIRRNHHVNIGVAVAVEDGLLVPVVKFADTKTLSQINAEVKDFAGRAKNKKLQPADWEGNTFTISNLGMFDIDEFTAIINPPDSCILAVGSIKQTPVVKNNQIVPGNVMKVTLSCDHRVVDGVTGSKFLQTFKALMENPIVLLGIGNL